MSEPSSGAEPGVRPEDGPGNGPKNGPETGGLGDRIAGAVLVAFALAMWLLVIPDQVDAVDYGWMRPQTLPGIATAVMGLLGLWLALAPSRRPMRVDPAQIARLAALLALVAAALWVMARVGFLWVAPALAVALVLLLGERRWPYLLGAAVGAPAAIWLVVVPLLQRSLP